MIHRMLNAAVAGVALFALFMSIVCWGVIIAGCKPNPTPAPAPKAPPSPIPTSVSLLCFSEPWCGQFEACRAAKGKQNALALKFSGRLELVEISRDEKNEFAPMGIVYNSLWERKVNGQAAASLYRQYGVGAIPAYVLLDHKGRELGRWTGADNFDEIEAAVARALK